MASKTAVVVQAKDREFITQPPAKEMDARDEAVSRFFKASKAGLNFIAITAREEDIEVIAIANRLGELLGEAKEAQQKFEAAWGTKAKAVEMAN